MNVVKQSSFKPEQLLVSRRDAARMLGDVSIATIKRLERDGRLRPRRLRRSSSANVFYDYAEVRKVAEATDDD